MTENLVTPTEMAAQRAAAAKLRLILASVEHKYDAGLPLTVKEETLLAELHRRRYLRPRERVHVEDDGRVQIVRTVDAEPVMDAMKAYGDFLDRHAKRKNNVRMIGSLDPVTAQAWATETGLKIGTKEFAKFAARRLHNDIDYRRFKVGG